MKQSKKNRDVTVFYSYASVDRKWRNKLANHLIQLKRDELISEWHDQQILAGSDRAQTIDQTIHSAQIILLLISADFLASDSCYQVEMQRALERHKRGVARVVPVLVRPCDWQRSPFAHLQCLPRNGKPITAWDNQDEAFVAVAHELRRIIAQQQFFISSPSNIQGQNRERLLKRVRATWVKELLEHSLHRAVWIDLHLQEQPDALENPWRLEMQEFDRSPRPLPIGTSIVEVYDEADGELLILGEPGAGKTTLLLELTRTLLDRAEEGERLRMPIVFNLSSWAEKRQSLRLWLQEELWMKYQVPRNIGQHWVDADQILLLLDGLDEVAKDARTACVQQINDYYQSQLEHGSSQIVLCCRSEEYATLLTRVTLQRAVSVLPFTDKQINTYLEQVGEQVKGLRQALDKDAQLRSMARQPLMLNIFTLAYQGAIPAEVPIGETREEVQYIIFARYVERMLRRRKRSKNWKPEQVIRYLTFLAKMMQQHNQTVFSVESLQPTWLSRRQKILYQWCVGLVSGLVCGLGFWLVVGLLIELVAGLIVGLIVGLVAGLVVGLLVGLFVGLDAKINPAEALVWSWKKALSGLLIGLLIGLIAGPIVGLVGGLAFGLLVGLSRIQFLERLSLSPNEGIWRSGKNGLLVGPLVGLLVWLIGGVVGGRFIGLLVWLLVWLIVWLVGGKFVGLGVGGLEAFMKHFILRFFLLLQGDLPWDLVAFLDEAAGRLLLRKVGGSYIFVHRLLLDYFVTLDVPVSTKSTSPVNKA